MSNQFHNRLVGTIVVVALGVIFLPDLLDGKNTQREKEFIEIPLRPSFTESGSENEVLGTVDIPAELQLQEEASTPKLKEHTVTLKTKAEETVVQLEKKAALTDVAYTIQLGSFKNAANVNALVTKLRKNGFTAYTLPKIPVDKSLTKVFVGPNISKSDLQKKLVEIEKLSKLNGKIVQFKPAEQ